MNKEYHIIVKGLVQGVSFRALVKKRAKALDLCGYVTNLKDGTVHICVQGEESVVRSFFDDLKQDPGLAKIESFSASVIEIGKPFSSFTICD